MHDTDGGTIFYDNERLGLPMKVIQYNREHINLIEMNEVNKAKVDKFIGYADAIDASAAIGDCGTLICDGRIIACVGILQLWDGVAEVWQVPSKYVDEYTLQYGRVLRRYVDVLVDTFNLHRLQAVCPNDEKHLRWMKFLGMEPEGLMKGYTFDKEDYLMCARCFDGN